MEEKAEEKITEQMKSDRRTFALALKSVTWEIVIKDLRGAKKP